MSALMISRITVKDPQKFKEYLRKTKEVAAPFGAELVFHGSAERALTGGEDHGVVVVVSFPSLEKLDAWYASDGYRPLIALRDQGADMQMTAYRAAS